MRFSHRCGFRALLLVRIIGLLTICGLMISCGGGGGSSSGGGSSGIAEGGDQSLLVGAHYYHWFPQNFAQGYLREKLVPQQGPLLGEYSSTNPAVSAQHIDWAADHGIRFFTLDWWPSRPRQNAAIQEGFLQSPNISRMKFCIFYETIDLGFDQSVVATVFDEGTKQRFIEDMEEIGRTYFSNPQYLRINNRPVVFFYVTRTLSGLYREAFTEARARLQNLGFDPFFIGDEIYWNVSVDGPSGPELSSEPNVARIRLFDAITAYNLYAPGFTTHAGFAATSQHLSDSAALYDQYRQAADGIPIVPSVLPGYNDRGHRLNTDHYVIPRQFSPGMSQGSLLREFFNQIGLPYADPVLRMVVVTSWNEWNEDTAIEPIGPSAETTTDVQGQTYTQGASYGGSGFEALEVIRDITGATRPAVSQPETSVPSSESSADSSSE